jgi:glycosyltransferase involved in cell wall biosynthesis
MNWWFAMTAQISIVTPSYNQVAFLPTTVQSVLGQDYANLEYIIMDGGSTDGTLDYLQQLTDPRVRWQSARDRGQSDAINRGLQQSQGEILAFLNSDDVYLAGTLRLVAEYFAQYPQVDVVYGHCQLINERGEVTQHTYPAKPLNWQAILSQELRIPQQAVFWRRRVLEKIGLFDETLHYRMDYDYWMRAFLAGMRFELIPRHLAQFRWHGQSKSINQDQYFWRDSLAILDKLYTQPHLPPEVSAMKALAYNMVQFEAGAKYFQYRLDAQARPHLAQFLRGSGTPRRKIYAAVMLWDCLFKTTLTERIVRFYRWFKHIPPHEI